MKKYRKFINYYLIFLVISVAMAFVSHRIIYITLYDKAVGERKQELTQGAEEIEGKLEGLFQTVNELYYYPDTIWLMAKDHIEAPDYPKLNQFRKLISITSLQDEWIADYYLYFPKSGVVFDKKRVYTSMDEVYENYVNVDGYDKDWFEKTFMESDVSFRQAEILNSNGKRYEVIPYIQKAMGWPDMIMVAMLDIQSMADTAGLEKDGSVYGIFQDGRLLYNHGLSDDSGGAVEKNVSITSESEFFQLDFQMVLSNNDLKKLMGSVWKGYLVILLAATAAATGALIMADRVFNRQFRKMAQSYEQQENVISSYHMRRLLDAVSSDKEVRQAGEFLELGEEGWAMAANLRCHKGNSVEGALRDMEAAAAEEEEKLLYVEEGEHKAVLLFYNVKAPAAVAEKYLDLLRKKHGDCIMVFGNPYQDTRGIAVSNMEARKAMDYRRNYPDSGICFYSQLPMAPELTILSVEDRNRLQVLLVSGEKEKAEKQFLELYGQYREALVLNPVLANNFIAQIAGVLIYGAESLVKNKKKKEELLLAVARLFDLPENMEFDKKVTELMEHICSFKDKGGKDDNEQIQKILNYIQDNYKDPDLALQKMGEVFHMNSAYFSQYFKQHTGKNFSQYLESVRILRAAELLEKTDKSVSEIMTESGYINRNTFYKAFIRVKGISPKAYKENILHK